jgi:hypothetical protein
MGFEYRTHQDLCGIISGINEKFYKPASENIIYLEELTGENAIAYIIALRDAYSHLVKIFEFQNILTHDNVVKIERQLERYSSHLERLLFDTYQKIISVKSHDLWAILPEEQKRTVKTQIAIKIKDLRIVSDSISNDEKIEGYVKIIDFIEEAYNKKY